MSFGINQNQIDVILDKHNLKQGETLKIDQLREAIAEIITENNKEIEYYLEYKYPELISRKLAMKSRGL